MPNYENLVKSLRYCINNGRCSDKCPAWKVKDCRTVIMRNAADAIEVLTHADVHQVVHGRWLEEPGHIPHCSVCGEYSDDADRSAKWCPFCGAKMDGRNE